MFAEQPYYEAKVFLRAYSDALKCLKESAEVEAHLQYQEHAMNRLIQTSKQAQIDVKDGKATPGLNFAHSRETKLFQFSNEIFAKYLRGFDAYTGNYAGFQHILRDGLQKLKEEK